ncbi:MAG: MmcQ/YjbR family DNA-binding protein [Nocardioidaceae bacterium]
MSHPQMYDDDDPYLARLRQICLDLPEAMEKTSHGRPNFYTKKVFAIFGGSIKGDHYAQLARCAVLIKADPVEQPALLQLEHFFTPAYVGAAGWVGLSFLPAGSPKRVDWGEVAELVETSYRLTAPTRLVDQLEG